MEEPVYILLGPEKGLKEDFIKKVKVSIGECEVSKFYGFEDYEEELFAQLNNFDLFGAHKLVILDEAQEIKTKEKAKGIVDYIKNPSDAVTFLILSSDLYIQPDIMAAIPNQKDCIVKFYELFESKKGEWLSNFFRRNDFSIDNDACSAIIERVDNNIQEFENVCSQIVVYYKTFENKKNITSDDVEEFLVHTREESDFSLFSFIAKRDLEGALECFQTLIHTTDAASVCSVLPSRLAMFFRKTLAIEGNIAKKMGIDDSMKTKTLDLERPVTMPKDRDIYKCAIRSFNSTDIKKILICLARYDIRVKEVGTMMQQTVMEKCISDIIVKKGHMKSKLEFASLACI